MKKMMQQSLLQHDLESILQLAIAFKAKIDQHHLKAAKRDPLISFVRFDLLLQPNRHILFKRIPEVFVKDILDLVPNKQSTQLIANINNAICDALISAGEVKNSKALFDVMGKWQNFIKPFLDHTAAKAEAASNIASTYSEFTSALPSLAKAEVSIDGKRSVIPNNKGKKYRKTAVSVPVAATITGVSAKTIRRSLSGTTEYRPAPLDADIDAVMAWGRYYWGIRGDKKMANAMNHPLNVSQLSDSVRKKYGL